MIPRAMCHVLANLARSRCRREGCSANAVILVLATLVGDVVQVVAMAVGAQPVSQPQVCAEDNAPFCQ